MQSAVFGKYLRCELESDRIRDILRVEFCWVFVELLAHTKRYTMQNWTFYPTEMRLLSSTEEARLTRKSSAVLSLLLERKGQVVSREEILKSVWQGVHVTPDLVREYVFDLRQALGDDARAPQYIETIRGKGFRLIDGIRLADRPHQDAHKQRPRIAVLRPSCDQDNWRGYADLLGHDLTVDLARFSDFAMIAPTSSFPDLQSDNVSLLADRLRCNYIVASALIFDGKRAHVNVRLISTRDEDIIWAKRYDVPAELYPQLASEMALHAANAMGGTDGAIARAEMRYARRAPLQTLSAYENYMLAQECEHQFEPARQKAGLNFIDKAISLDPNFARSHLIRSFLCDHGMSYAPERGLDYWLNEMMGSAEKAYALDPRDPLIVIARAIAYATEGNVPAARDLAVKGADLSENEATAAILSANASTLIVGDFGTAADLIKCAYDLNPTPPGFYKYMHARNCFFSGDYSEAESIAADGPDYLSTYVVRCLAQTMQDKTEGARHTLKLIETSNPGFSFEEYPKNLGIANDAVLAHYSEAVDRLKRV